ncbi:ferredoxin [Pseudonocardia nematodicida]|uniref:Ferredoxin n=1 Tax=Pseudonocardia nematodicida TaxID=1206997 RepID=A0ABV1K830_9PSEU
MNVEVDEDACVGAGQCVLAAPLVFDQREDDGIVELLTAEVPPSEQGRVTEAVNRCPAAAIRAGT